MPLAVIRIDGPGGGDTPPPAWATADLLTGKRWRRSHSEWLAWYK